MTRPYDMSPPLVLGGAALNQTPLDWANNLQNIREAILEAKARGVELLCLPELCISGYGCEDLFLGDWLYDTCLEKLKLLLQETKEMAVTFGIPFKFEGIRYNCAVLVENERIIGIVPKQHLANDGVHYEPRWFQPWKPGDATFFNIDGEIIPFGDHVLEIKGVKVGFEICEDAWRDTRPGHSLCERGVDIILNPSASHFAFHKSQTRKTLVATSSQEFHCWYVYANLLGNEAGKMIYDGEIMIAYKGKITQHNPLLSKKPWNLLTSRDALSNEYHNEKSKEFPAAVSLALFDYLRKSRTRAFVLSLSGGADSSACAILVSHMVRSGVQELGIDAFCERLRLIPPTERSPEAITHLLLLTAYQGTINSSEDTFLAAKELADSVGAQFYHWKIDDEVQSYTTKIEKALGRQLEWKTDDIALQNIQARARSPIIWMLTNLSGALLLTTSNRSEGDVGYATMDGDTSGSIAPIAGVDKHYLRQWLHFAEKELDFPGLERVNNLAPSAELRPQDQKQTDEDDLMPYDILAQIERLAIYQYKSPLETFQHLLDEHVAPKKELLIYVKKFFRLWAINQWKRERIAPAFHLDDFNVDPRSWCRFPILSSAFQEEIEALEKEN